jgi:galactose mutarotase-like enzyme
MSVYQLKNNELNVKVNSFGAELSSIFSLKNNIEYIWQANPEIWPRHAPHLFPIVGKLKDGSFNVLNNTYQLPQHGFARDNDFESIECSENSLTFELKANDETLKQFPFDFSLKINYTLLENKLITSYEIFNPGSNELNFSIGAHPAFNCPLQKDESFMDYSLVFPNKNELVINTLHEGLIKKETKTLTLNNNKLSVSKSLFDNDALVFMNSQIEQISLISEKTSHGVTMECFNWPFFGIWTKNNYEQFICLEPWQGIADSETDECDFKNKKGIITLLPKQKFNCSFNIICF